MALTVEELIVRIEADIRNLKSNLRQATRETDRAGTRMGRSFRRVDQALKRTQSNVLNLRNAMLVALAGAAIRKSVKTFGDLETGFIRVAKTANLTETELKDLEERIFNLAETPGTGATIQELQEIAATAGQLGVQGVEDITQFTQVIAQLAGASDVTGEAGATMIARILGLAKLPIGAVDNFTSALVFLGNNAKATEAEILEVASGIARGGAQFGLSGQAILGLATAFREADVDAEVAGSTFNRVMTEISTAVAQGGEELTAFTDVMGLTREEIAQLLDQDPAQVFVKFIEGLRSLDRAGRINFLDAVGLTDIRVSRTVNSLAQTFDVLKLRIDQAAGAWEENTARIEEALRAADSFNAQMKVVGNVVERAAFEVGRELAPVIAELAADFRQFVTEARESGDLQRWAQTAADAIRWLAENMDKLAIAAALFFGARVAVGLGRIAAGAVELAPKIGRLFAGMESLGLAAGNFALRAGPRALAMFGLWGIAIGGAIEVLRVLWPLLEEGVPINERLAEAIMKAKNAVDAFKDAVPEQAEAMRRSATQQIMAIQEVIAALEQQLIAQEALSDFSSIGAESPALRQIREAKAEVSRLLAEVQSATIGKDRAGVEPIRVAAPPPPPPKPDRGEVEGTRTFAGTGDDDTADDIQEMVDELERAVDAQNLLNAAFRAGPAAVRVLEADLRAVADAISAGALEETISLDEALKRVRSSSGDAAAQIGKMNRELASGELTAEMLEAEDAIAKTTEELETQLRFMAMGNREVRVQIRLLQLRNKYGEEFARSQEEAIRREESLADDVERVTDAMSDLKDESNAVADAIGDLGLTFSSAFEDAVVEGEKLSDILQALEKDLLRFGLRKLFTEPLFEGIEAGVRGEPTTGGGISQVISEGISGVGDFFGLGGGVETSEGGPVPVPRAKPLGKAAEAATAALEALEGETTEVAEAALSAAGGLTEAGIEGAGAGGIMANVLTTGAIQAGGSQVTVAVAADAAATALTNLAVAAAAAATAMAAGGAASASGSATGGNTLFNQFGAFSGMAGRSEGGRISGPGTDRSDSIPAMLSDGEFVVNARAVRKHGALLEALNANRFADGGFVTGGGAKSPTQGHQSGEPPRFGDIHIHNPRDSREIRRNLAQIRSDFVMLQERAERGK